MHDFEVTDDLTMNIGPAVIPPDNAYAIHTSAPTRYNDNAFGFKVGLRF
jgi:hypothetical protein